MKDIEIILNEKKMKIEEMNKYNERLDAIIIYYILGVYAAIGIKISGKLNLDILNTSNEYVYLIFVFIFLNLCIVLHGISQSSYSIALAKYIYLYFDLRIQKTLQMQTKNASTIKDLPRWDDWKCGISNLAKNTRNIVFFGWILLVFGISLYSLTFICFANAYEKNPIVVPIICLALYIYLSYIIYSDLLLYFYIKKYKLANDFIKKKMMKLIVIFSIIITFFKLSYYNPGALI